LIQAADFVGRWETILSHGAQLFETLMRFAIAWRQKLAVMPGEEHFCFALQWAREGESFETWVNVSFIDSSLPFRFPDADKSAGNRRFASFLPERTMLLQSKR
jgi:hypothetical protein